MHPSRPDGQRCPAPSGTSGPNGTGVSGGLHLWSPCLQPTLLHEEEQASISRGSFGETGHPLPGKVPAAQLVSNIKQ